MMEAGNSVLHLMRVKLELIPTHEIPFNYIAVAAERIFAVKITNGLLLR